MHVQSFPWPRIVCLELRVVDTFYDDSSHNCLPFVMSAVRAATTAHGLRQLIITDGIQSYDSPCTCLGEICAGEICAAAPQLEHLELNMTLEDGYDVSPLQSLHHLKHLGIRRTRYTEEPSVKGLCAVLNSCMHLESLVLPHAMLHGLTGETFNDHYTSSPSRFPQARCHSVVQLRIAGVVADTLPDVRWLLDNVFPRVKHLDIGCLQLVNYAAALEEDREAAMLERIKRGAADVLANGRARLVNETGELILLGVDLLNYGNEGLYEAQYGSLYVRALRALFSGWLGGENGSCHASKVRSIIVANMLVTSGLLSECARYFHGVRTLLIDQDTEAFNKKTPDDFLLLSKCISSFPLLSHVSVAPFWCRMDLDVLRTAVLLACHQVHLKEASGKVVFCLQNLDYLNRPNMHADFVSARTEVERVLAQYESTLENHLGEGVTSVMRVALEVSNYKAIFSEVRGCQFYNL